MPSRTQLSLRLALIGIVTAVAVLVAAPIAWGANESIGGTVTDDEAAGNPPLAGVCVTAEGDSGVVVGTTAADGTYSIPVAPGDHVVRFDDCGTSSFGTEYWDDALDRDEATVVTVAPDEQVTGIDAALYPTLRDTDGAPETTIESGPSGTTSNTAVSFEFSSNDEEASFECSLDGAAYEYCTSPAEYTELADGPHNFSVRAVDFHGNRDLTPESRAFTVDSPAPDGRIVSGPEGTISTRDVVFEFTSDDPDNSEYLCRLDDGAAEPCTSPQAYTGLDDGPHTFVLRTRIRNGGPVDQSPSVQSFYVNVTGPADTDAPATTITGGPLGTIGTTGAAFEFESDETWSTFECSLDGAAFEACQSPYLVTGLGNGEHELQVRATDPAGNVETPPASRIFAVDTSIDDAAPETTIDSGPTGTVEQDYAIFGFSSSEGNSTFECRFNGGAWDACGSPRTFTGLGDGVYTFEVAARDSAGNLDLSPASATFEVDSELPPDTDPPETAIDAGPSAGSTIASRSATFGFSSSEDGSSFECRINDGTWRTCTSQRTFTGLDDGSHVFEVRATDPAGNRDAPVSRAFSVDATPPDTLLADGPDGQRINTTSAQYAFESTEAGVSYECRLDSGLWGNCSNPHTITGLSEGTHTLSVRAKDAIGNVDGTPLLSAFTVDLTAPETVIDNGPSGTVRAAGQFEFHANEAAFFECRIDGGAWDGCNSPHDVGTLGDGPHTFEVRATDAAGNPDGSPASRAFTIDSSGPATTITSGPSGTITTRSATFAFSADEPGQFQCQLDGSGWSPCTSPQAYGGLANGSHTFQVRAVDGLGNEGQPTTRTFTVDIQTTNPPPPPPPGPDPACASAQKQLDSAQKGVKKAKQKVKKAKGKAKKKAKKKLKKAKTKLKKAKSAVASSC